MPLSKHNLEEMHSKSCKLHRVFSTDYNAKELAYYRNHCITDAKANLVDFNLKILCLCSSEGKLFCTLSVSLKKQLTGVMYSTSL